MAEFTPGQKEIAKKMMGKQISAKDEQENVTYVSYLETERYILEQILRPTHTTHTTHTTETTFLQFEKETSLIEEVNEFRSMAEDGVGEMVYKPIIDDLLRTRTVSLPTGAEEYGTIDLLIKEIRDFFSLYFELPIYYINIVSYLILFYWVYEKFPFVPYVHFVGRTSTGKTTAMEVFGSLCYKPIDASGAITMSSIFRTASSWRGTLLLDEFNTTGENYAEMLSFLKSGVSNRAVLRVEGDKQREVRAYMIKCPKIFTSEVPVSDAGLQSSTIVIKMEKNKRRIPLYRLKGYEEAVGKIRNKLLLWRFRNLNKINLTEIEYGFPELQSFDRRVQQVITPIFYFSGEETKKDIVEFAKKQEEETFRERREALDGQIFQCIVDNYPIEPALKLITEIINKDRGIQRQYTEKKIANVIRKVLGFDIERRGSENISTVVLNDPKKMEELNDYYGCVLPVVSVVSVASVVNSTTNKDEIDQETRDIFLPIDDS